jgi:putative hydrolase of HD superfamily
VLAEWSNAPIDVIRVVQMLILHDLVELECGDTPLFEEVSAATQTDREREAADRLYGMLPEGQAEQLRAIWDEFEEGRTDDAAFAKAIDRLQPIILNHMNRGGTWADYQVDIERERNLTKRIAGGSNALWDAAEAIFGEAVEGGWLLSKPPVSTGFTA